MHLCATICALVAASSPPAHPLTLQDAFELARVRTPEVLAANTAWQEMKASRVGATPLFAVNPSVEGGIGSVAHLASRFRDGDYGGTASFQLNVPVEIALQRQARVASVDAHSKALLFAHSDAVRAALFRVGDAFYRAQHDELAHRITRLREGAAERAVRATQLRFQAEQVAQVEVSVAELELHEAQRATLRARAQAQQSLRMLGTLLGLSPSDLTAVDMTGAPAREVPALSALLSHLDTRPDLMATGAERAAAARDAELARSTAFPTPTLKVAYQYSHPDHAMVTLVEFPLPVFNRNQGEEARARTRESGLTAELDARRRSARAEVESARELVVQLDESIGALGSDNGSALMERLEREYAAHNVDLTTLLNVTHRVVQAQLDEADLAYQRALAWLWLDSASGALQ